MLNRLSLRLDISTFQLKNLPSTRSIGGAHIQQNAVVLNLFFHLPTTWRSRMTSTWKHGKHDIQLLHGPRPTPTFSKSPVIPLEAHMRCGTSPETAATHFFLACGYAGRNLRDTLDSACGDGAGGELPEPSLESSKGTSSTWNPWDKRQPHQPYKFTTDRTVNSLCFRLSHSKWPQVLKK